MTLTLITVNYNGTDDTIVLLESLRSQTDTAFDVVVVDNDSSPAQREQLGAYVSSSQLPLDVIYSPVNTGFSGGNNIGIRKALAQGAQWVLLINNDTTVAPEFIETLRTQIPATPCVVGLPLNEGEHIAYAGMVRWLRPTLPHYYEPVGATTDTYAIGAGLLVHRDVFEKIGLLDERYFLYFEDADFSMQARRGGAPVRFLTEPIITHHISQSTKGLGAPLLLRYHARNTLLFNWKYGPWWVRGSLPFISFFGIVFQLAKILLMPSRRPASRAIAAGIIDFYAKTFGKIRQQ